MKKLRVIIGCEFSGIVRDAFSLRGHDAWSCDLLPTESDLTKKEDKHLQEDILEVLKRERFDLGIFHPPCTYLSYAANHCWNEKGRARKRIEAMEFFLKLAEADIEKICIENPVGAINTIYRKPDQIVEPFYFGDSQRKRTCLWLKNLPILHHCETVELFSNKTHCPPPEAIYRRKTDGKAIHFAEANHGGHKRSKSFRGIAEAMATQWG